MNHTHILLYCISILSTGVFDLLSMDIDGQNGETRRFNTRYCVRQNRYHSGNLVVRHQWTVLDHPCRAYAVLNWTDLGKVQIVYLKSNENYDLGLEFLTIAKNTWPLPQVLSISSGIGKEILFYISCDAHKTSYIHICDYPDTMMYPDNGLLCWLGDIQLYTLFQKDKFTFTDIQPINFRFGSHDAHNSSYLIEYKESQQKLSPLHYEIMRISYKPPKHWRHNRGAKTTDRSSPENYFTEAMSWHAERYTDIDEFELGWDSVTVKALDASGCQLIPTTIALVNAQNILGNDGKKLTRID